MCFTPFVRFGRWVQHFFSTSQQKMATLAWGMSCRKEQGVPHGTFTVVAKKRKKILCAVSAGSSKTTLAASWEVQRSIAVDSGTCFCDPEVSIPPLRPGSTLKSGRAVEASFQFSPQGPHYTWQWRVLSSFWPSNSRLIAIGGMQSFYCEFP